MAFSSPFKLVAGMICGVSLLLIAENDLARAEKFPKVEREPVLADQKAHDTEWRTRIAASKSRVFFTDAEWPQVIAEVAKIDPQHPFRKYVDDALKKVLEKPVPTYYTPEEKVARKEAPSLYSAMEELWQRQVGEDLITLSLAVKLNLANDATLAACRTRMKELAMAACSWPTWGRGYRPMPDNADLSCGHLSLGLSYAYNLHGATVFTETERAMIRKAMREKVAGTLSGLYGAAYWATGYQDNHLQVDVAGLGVAGTVFYDEIPEAPEWMAAARLAHVNIARFSQTDGSSDEGIPYWSYARWATVHYIEGTRPVTRADSMYQDPFLKNAISWRLYSSTCGFAGTLPWGDAPPRDYYGPHFLLLQVGAACNDPTGLWLTEHLPFRPQGGSDGPLITLLFGRKAFAAKKKTGDATGGKASGEFMPGLDAHFPVNDSVTTRGGWSADDFIVALKSGFTNRNHSHLDAGALALAFGSKWSLRAPGYGKGSSQKGYWDSSKLRWTYFSNATESHTTFLVNGKNQRHDPKARGTVDEFLSAPRWAWASVDLTSACYDVAPSGGARRSLLHRRGEYALVLDSVNAADAAQPVKVEWLAQVIADPMPIKAESGFASNTLRIPGGGEAKNRELLITPLDAAQSFTRREPTAEHIDLPKESIRTYSLSATGAKVRFAVLLQPLPLASGSGTSTGGAAPASGQTVAATPDGSSASAAPATTAPALTTKCETEENGAVRRITIAGASWTDRIVVADAPRAWKLDAEAGAPPVSATAEMLAVRQSSGEAKDGAKSTSGNSLIASRVSEISAWGVGYKGAPACISIQRVSADAFIIDADRDVQSAITPPKGLSVFELPLQSPAPGAGKRYVLGTSKDAAMSAARQTE